MGRAHLNAAKDAQRFQFHFVLRSPLSHVFAVYADTDRWCHRGFANDVRWVQGNPWEEGSRMRIEVSNPVPAVIEQVLLHYEPKREIVYASHVLGVTLNTRVAFTSASENQTEIHVVVEVAGEPWPIFNFGIESAVAKTTRRFFEDLKRDCEWSTLHARQTEEAEKLSRGGLTLGESGRSSRP